MVLVAEILYNKLIFVFNFSHDYAQPECTNVCFRYTPPRIAALPEGPERDTELVKVAPQIKKLMMEQGTMMIAYQPLKEHINFFRMINANPGQTHQDMEFVLDEIERLGRDL